MSGVSGAAVRRSLGRTEVVLLAVIVLIGVLVTLKEPAFASQANIINTLFAVATIGIAAIGQAFVITTGEIDLSVAATLSFTALEAASLMQHGVPVPIAALIGIALGAIIGAVNALITVYFKVNSFIVTLGTMSVVQGLTLWVSSGLPIATPNGLNQIGSGTKIAGIPLPVIILILLAIVAQLVLTFTVLGRRVLATGDNQEAARLSGIPTVNTKVLVFALAGGLAAVAGILRAASLGTAQASDGSADLLPIIAAVVVGGVSLLGGRGSMIGVLLGAVLLGEVQNAYVILRLSNSLQLATFGAVIVIAGIVDQLRQGSVHLRAPQWLTHVRTDPGGPSEPPPSTDQHPTPDETAADKTEVRQ